MMTRGETIASILARGPVLPVVVIDEPEAAVELARALLAGGVTTIEITLRTRRALDCVRAVREAVPALATGVGTVRDAAQLAAAERAGAAFAVSPGATGRLLDAAADTSLPLLPGASTASEVMTLAERGYSLLKFFPAEPAGGAAFLQALASPLPDVRFCPTGGVGPDNAGAYLTLANVICVGGSWLAPAAAVAAGDWRHVQERAADAVATLSPTVAAKSVTKS